MAAPADSKLEVGPKVLIEVVGSLNMDLVTVTKRVPGPGETLAASSFSTGHGGKGANQAVAAARLLRQDAGSAMSQGVDVVMYGMVGDDGFGDEFVKHMKREGIDVSNVGFKQGFATGTSVIIVEQDSGENRILFNAGANGQLTADDIKLAQRGESGSPQYALFQMEIPIATLTQTIAHAKKLGKTVLLNTAPVELLPDEVFDGLDFLIMNENEAALLSAVPEDQITTRLDEIASIFFRRGVKAVIITLGSQGAYFHDRKSSTKGTVPAAAVEKVVDTTAAGDTFCGAFAVSLARGTSDLAAAVEFANRAAARTVQKAGAQASMPFHGEL